ncbi:MAG: hypothetical protein ACTSR8_21260 [Promethearchaeota archaeon]
MYNSKTLIRKCPKCGKESEYSKVRKMISESQQDEFRNIWINSDIDFYCSTCYFLKLIKILRKKL